jgi:hypothetical protein
LYRALIEAASSLEATDKQLFGYKLRDQQQRGLIYGLRHEWHIVALQARSEVQVLKQRIELNHASKALVRKSKRIKNLRDDLEIAGVVIKHYADKDKGLGANESPAVAFIELKMAKRPQEPEAPPQPDPSEARVLEIKRD